MLLARIEAADAIYKATYQRWRGQFAIELQAFNDPLLPKFFASIIRGLGDSVGVKRQRVSRDQATFLDGTL